MKTSFGNDPGVLDLQYSAGITLSDSQLEIKWKHCTISADFLSQFYVGVLSHEGFAGRVNDMIYSIGYMANELIENAVKFRTAGELKIEAGLTNDSFSLRIGNWITRETSSRFQTLLKELTTGDPGELLIERIEANAAGESGGSGLGLLTLMNDYEAQIFWSFDESDESPDEKVFIETIAQISLSR